MLQLICSYTWASDEDKFLKREIVRSNDTCNLTSFDIYCKIALQNVYLIPLTG